MNNELIGTIETDASLVGEVTDSQLEINVSVAEAGPRGKEGKSAYETWLDLGNEGTEEDFMAYLRDVDFGLINYEEIDKKPSIESVELIGNKTFEDLGISNINKVEISNIF